MYYQRIWVNDVKMMHQLLPLLITLTFGSDYKKEETQFNCLLSVQYLSKNTKIFYSIFCKAQ